MSSDEVEASLSEDRNASLLNRASLLTPLNYPGGPCPTLPSISKHKPHRQRLAI